MKRHLLLFAAGFALLPPSAQADDPVVPTSDYTPSRYQVLWTKSPFAVETSEATVETSPDYMLVGFANIDGVSYASIIERQSPQGHYLISSDKPVKGLTLKSITIGKNGSDTYAVINRNGQEITLKLEQTAASGGTPGVPPANIPMPGVMTPQIPMPGAVMNTNPGSNRPFTPPRFHRPPIHLPPRAEQQQAAPPPTPAP
jgi:hypothetical protein